jgi:hypothetical protein
MALDTGARLHLLDGAKIDVAQLPKDAARLLWGNESGDDAHDMGYAALQNTDAKPLLVNPHAVAYITETPTGRTKVYMGD